MATIGERIRQARKNARIAQGELAKMIHTSQSYICDIEHSRANPSVSTMQAIARVLNVDVAEFISDGGLVKETGLANDEIHLLMTYRNLSDSDKELAQTILQRFVLPPKARYSTSISAPTRTHKVAMGG